eukprot:10837840-Ditylum_brightwellii.AAC.1
MFASQQASNEDMNHISHGMDDISPSSTSSSQDEISGFHSELKTESTIEEGYASSPPSPLALEALNLPHSSLTGDQNMNGEGDASPLLAPPELDLPHSSLTGSKMPVDRKFASEEVEGESYKSSRGRSFSLPIRSKKALKAPATDAPRKMNRGDRSRSRSKSRSKSRDRSKSYIAIKDPEEIDSRSGRSLGNMLGIASRRGKSKTRDLGSPSNNSTRKKMDDTESYSDAVELDAYQAGDSVTVDSSPGTSSNESNADRVANVQDRSVPQLSAPSVGKEDAPARSAIGCVVEDTALNGRPFAESEFKNNNDVCEKKSMGYWSASGVSIAASMKLLRKKPKWQKLGADDDEGDARVTDQEEIHLLAEKKIGSVESFPVEDGRGPEIKTEIVSGHFSRSLFDGKYVQACSVDEKERCNGDILDPSVLPV